MIYYFKPFSVNGSLFEAYKAAADIVKNPKDWICFLDGDTMFLQKDYGIIIDRYVKKYPSTGLFTSYASRCSYIRQVPSIGNQASTDILFHVGVSRKLQKFALSLAVKKIDDKIAGHLILIKKETWNIIEPRVREIVIEKKKKILGIDTAISRAVLGSGKEILLMRAVYLIHLFRLDGRRY